VIIGSENIPVRIPEAFNFIDWYEVDMGPQLSVRCFVVVVEAKLP
jgi:hypothetical protein